ncbi:MAG: hypothetical protein Fur0043_10930 [Anaerolineales bacterium]
MSGSKREQVTCRSDVEYADRPLSLVSQGHRLEIVSILARWRAPGEKGFRVQTNDGQIFELTYREIPDEWDIQPI